MSKKDKEQNYLDDILNDPFIVEPFTVNVGDDINVDWDDMNTITIPNTYDSSITLGDVDTITFEDNIFTSQPTLTVGKYTLTEEKLEKLDALLEAIDLLSDDNDLKSLLDSVRMLKKLKNED